MPYGSLRLEQIQMDQVELRGYGAALVLGASRSAGTAST